MQRALTVGALAIPAARAVRRATLLTLAAAALVGATLTSFDAARLSTAPAEAPQPSTAAVQIEP